MDLLSSTFLRVYRASIVLLPEEHRREYREEMLETVRMREDDLGGAGGLRLAGFWIREIRALLKEGIRMRLSSLFRLRASVPFTQVPFGLRLAIRSLLRSPAFSLTATLTLALGIGATTVIFSFVNGILLTPLPYEDPAGLVMFETFDGETTSLSEPEFMGFRTGSSTLESVAAVREEARIIQMDGQSRRIISGQATHELFPMLGIPPLVGRAFTDREDLEGAPRVALLTHDFWQEMFGGDPRVVGETVDLDGDLHEIIGVLPEEFRFPDPETVLWTPYHMDPANLDTWNNHYLDVYGRLTDGTSLEVARAEVSAMGQRFVEDHPEYLRDLGFTADLNPLTEVQIGDTRTPLLVLMGAVGFLLLIGCTNVANLMLARGEARRQETAVRSALGASRPEIVFQSLIESLTLSAVGGAAGVALAILGVRFLRSLASVSIPRAEEIVVDPGVLVFAATVTVLTGILFGLLPALTTSRTDLQRYVKEGGRGLSGSMRGNVVRRALVATEVALAVVLVVGAGIMLRSLSNLDDVDTGFRTADVLAMRMTLTEASFGRNEATVGFFREVVDQVEGLPGVESAGLVSNLPLAQGIGLWSIALDGQELEAIGEAPVSEVQQVTHGYFRTMGLTLVDGRFLQSSDGSGSGPAVVVNEAFVRQLWRGEDAIGRQVRLFSNSLPWMTVVGVVKDERHRSLLADVRPKMYVPHAQGGESMFGALPTMNLVVHGRGVSELVRPIRAIVNELNAAVPVFDVRTMEDVRSLATADRSYPTRLLAVFGLFALFLASVGIFGLVSVHVSQGRQDLGVHVALGATAGDVRGLVLTKGMGPVVVGLALGLAGAAMLTRVLTSLLYEVSPVDPPVFLGVAGILLCVSVLASLVPAVRATRLDPMEVLRSE